MTTPTRHPGPTDAELDHVPNGGADLLTWPTWQEVVVRLNATQPGRAVERRTVEQWWHILTAEFPAGTPGTIDVRIGEIWAAVRAVSVDEWFRLDQNGIAQIVAGIRLARDDAARLSREQAERAAADAARQPGRRGVRPPGEYLQARKILAGLRDTTPPDERRAAREEIEALAARIQDRVDRRRPAEHAEDAVRTCAGCAHSSRPGWLAVEWNPDDPDQALWTPCGDCRPGRHAAWRKRHSHLPHDDKGYPRGAV
jgi:hypothetical protein